MTDQGNLGLDALTCLPRHCLKEMRKDVKRCNFTLDLTLEGKSKSLQYSCLEDPMNSMIVHQYYIKNN